MPYLTESSLNSKAGSTVLYLQLIRNKGSEGLQDLPKDKENVQSLYTIKQKLHVGSSLTYFLRPTQC